MAVITPNGDIYQAIPLTNLELFRSFLPKKSEERSQVTQEIICVVKPVVVKTRWCDQGGVDEGDDQYE